MALNRWQLVDRAVGRTAIFVGESRRAGSAVIETVIAEKRRRSMDINAGPLKSLWHVVRVCTKPASERLRAGGRRTMSQDVPAEANFSVYSR